MERYSIVLGLIFILFIFIGCIEEETYSYSDKIELIDYTVKTQRWDDGYKTIKNGFVYSKDAELYLITGTVKNIAGETLIRVNVTAKFYDESNNFLKEKKTYLGGIPNNKTVDFGIYYFVNEEYFGKVFNVKFEFDVI
jgi:hypothetical protein